MPSAITQISLAFATLLFSIPLALASPQNGPPGGTSSGASSNGGASASGSDPSTGSQSYAEKGAAISHIAMIHGTTAVLAWAFFMPLGAVLLRLNIQSPIILKLHAACQIFAFLLYFCAVGMGVWVIKQIPAEAQLWHKAHPILGLAIFVLAFLQPIWGFVHHRIFKKRLATWKTGQSKQKPGRTAWGRIHLWVGRILITLAIVNGALGLILANANNPYADPKTVKTQYIAYGAVTGAVWVIYVLTVSLWEYRKSLPSQNGGSEEELYPMKRGPYVAVTQYQ